MHAGRFCALWTLREQLLIDRAVDVYQLAKLYHLKRPGIIGGQVCIFYFCIDFKTVMTGRANIYIWPNLIRSGIPGRQVCYL